MVVHNHDGEPPTVRTGVVSAGAPVFVDVTGRRCRLVRRCGLLLGGGSLVYLPLVALAVLSGPTVPAPGSAPRDDAPGLAMGHQPAAPPEMVDPAAPPFPPAADDAEGEPAAEPPVDAVEPGPRVADPVTGRRPEPLPPGPGGGLPLPTPTTVDPTPPTSPPGPTPTPSATPTTAPPTAPAITLLDWEYPT
ncbi:hypothetical protein ACVCAH_06325 [Micromonospora sp. LZ34]